MSMLEYAFVQGIITYQDNKLGCASFWIVNHLSNCLVATGQALVNKPLGS